MKNTLRNLCLPFVFACIFCPIILAYSGGDGTTSQTAYQISSVADWQQLMSTPADWGSYFSLTANLDMQGITLTPVGMFSGVFKGNDYTISNVTINVQEGGYLGLFGLIDYDSRISDLTVLNVSVTGSWTTGGLAGLNEGTISNCHVTGTVSGTSIAGGLAGTNLSTITKCSADVVVNCGGLGTVGGLVGNTGSNSLLSFSYASGSVSGHNCGGLAGSNSGKITDCYATGNVNASYFGGGLVGWNSGAILDSPEGPITEYSYIINSYSTGFVSGSGSIGGLIGQNYELFEVTSCFWDITTSGNTAGVGNGNASGITGLPTADMQTLSTFTDAEWDFNTVWNIIENVSYPQLQWPAKYSGGMGTQTNPYSISNAVDWSELVNMPEDWASYFVLTRDIDLAGLAILPVGNESVVFTGVFDGQGHTISNAVIQDGYYYVGIFGFVAGGQIRNVNIINANVQGVGAVGGLVGYADSAILNGCSVTGSINGDSSVGGLTGAIYFSTIAQCCAAGAVNGSECIGGLVGDSFISIIQSCYALSDVQGSFAGGLVGTSQGLVFETPEGPMAEYSYINDCYAAGTVSLWGGYIGGLVGGNGDLSIASGCFWDVDLSGLTEGAGYGPATGMTGKTTLEMQTLSTFAAAGWDFTTPVWQMPVNNYPRLAWETVSANTNVPDVIGLTQAAAEAAITLEGLIVGTVSQAYSDTMPAGYVSDQTPVAGTSVSPGSAIDIVVSLGVIYGGGNGTQQDPYQIWTPAQMNAIGLNPNHWFRCFILMADIDMSDYTGTEYNIIGNSATNFIGIFDGNGHVIRNLTYTTTDYVECAGLFGFVRNGYFFYDAAIRNIGLENVNISTGGGKVGGLVGYWSQSSGMISNCYSTGSISISASNSYNYAGGLVGTFSYGGTISNCYSTASISASANSSSVQCTAGGLIGLFYSGTLSNCHSTGPVTATAFSPSSSPAYCTVGGLVGSQSSGTISNCYSTGLVTASSPSSAYSTWCRAGGLIGQQYGNNSAINNCYSTGSVSATSLSSFSASQCVAGGIVGVAAGTVNGCYSTGSVSASSRSGCSVGGLAGSLTLQDSGAASAINNCYSSSLVSCSAKYTPSAGGAVGNVFSSNVVTSCYATGAVSGSSESGTVNMGGVIGYNGGAISACFWDTETTSLQDGIGRNVALEPADVTGKTTEEMQTLLTFTSAGWDFTTPTWQMPLNDYPCLAWEPYSGGEGTVEKPYQIGSADDWQELMATPADWGAHFILTANIDLAGITATPVGGETMPFTGVFDGRGHTVNKLAMDLPDASEVGLFGFIKEGGRIQNLGLMNADVSGYEIVGCLAAANFGVISNCFAVGNVNGTNGVGGLAGANGGTVNSCYAAADVSGQAILGGLIGMHGSGAIANCYTSGSVEGTEYVGGLIGIDYQAAVVNCYSTGLVIDADAGYLRGGLCGWAETGGDYQDIANFWDTETSQTAYSEMGTGLQTAQMQTRSSFAGWDFDTPVWMINGQDYPRLVWNRPDIDGSGRSDIGDFGSLAGRWNLSNCGFCDGADLTGDGKVNIDDLLVITDRWLEERSINEHVFEIWIETVWDYDEPGQTTDNGYDFEIGTVTDSTVSKVEFVTPAGNTFVMNDVDFDMQTGRYEWSYKLETSNLHNLDAFGDGLYTLKIYFPIGQFSETSVLLGIPNSGEPIPQPVQEPVISSFAHNTVLSSPVSFAWQPCTDAAAQRISVCVKNLADGSEQGYLADTNVTALSQPVVLVAGHYEIWLNFEVWYESTNNDDIPVYASKYSEADYLISIE